MLGLTFGFKRPDLLPREDAETREARTAAAVAVESARAAEKEINELARNLIARRDRNHFGEELTVSFTPRHKGRHA